jgi:two-component system sensor kinase FixL
MGERSSGWASSALGGDALASERHFQRLLEHLPAGAYTCDARGLITYFNPSAEALWGRCPALLDPRDRYCGSFQLYTREGEAVPHDLCWMAQAIEQRRGFNGQEIVIVRPDGTRRTVLAHANPYYDESGELLGGVNVLVDITPQRERDLERDRLRKRAAEAQRLESLGSFAGGMAHELNNMLTIMLGCAELVRRDAMRPDTQERLIQHVEEIQNAGARAKNLLHQVLTFSRPPSGGRHRVALGSVVDQAVALMRSSLLRDLTLHVHADPRTPAIDGDAAQLSQAVINLCSNAVHAMKGRRGVLKMVVEHVVQAEDLPRLPRGEYARLSVTDNGVGIPEHVLPHIFEPFFTTKEVGSGAGLGLAVVFGTMEAHGGFVDVRSEPEQGTTFLLYFPRASH